MNGVGQGYAVAQTAGGAQVFGSWLDHDHFAARRRGSTASTASGAAKPEVASTDQADSAIAWRLTGADGNSVARARYHDGEDANGAFGGELTVSRGDLGPVADPGVSISADRSGDVAVAMVQGAPGARTLAVAIYDRPPGAPFIDETEAYKRKTRPELRWRPGNDPWGAQTFRDLHGRRPDRPDDGDHVVPATPLATGKHTWQVESVDRAGQISRSRVRTLKIDATPPTLKVKVSGKRAARQGAEDHGHGERRRRLRPGPHHGRLRRQVRRRRRPDHAAPLQARPVHPEGRGRRQGGQRDAHADEAAHQEVVILRAGARRLDARLRRPLLMGILNATPDSFSDGARGRSRCPVRLERGRALVAAGADIIDVGGESARGDRPAVSAGEEIARVEALVVRSRQGRRPDVGRYVQV